VAAPPAPVAPRAETPAPLPPPPSPPRAQVLPYAPPQRAAMRPEPVDATASFDYEDYTNPTVEMPPPVVPISRPIAARTRAPSAPPATVIPVPRLPSVKTATQSAQQPPRLEPVVRTTAPRRAQPATRAPDPTTRTHAAPPPPDDRTSPSLVLPRVAAR
jgi:hypothetical protein